jgi:hypothetical protein
MSGIFKSVKKTLKKVGKVIKKIAPVLIVAAAVYFGGAYLMSMGAGSAAAGSAATSVTKSAGVWKSFFSGLGNGTAAQSAAAYAEASYVSMQAGAALSTQVAAGTNAVQALSVTQSTQQAVAMGVNAGDTYAAQIASGATSDVAAQTAAQTVTGGSTVPVDIHVKSAEQIGIDTTSSTFAPPSEGIIEPSTYSAASVNAASVNAPVANNVPTAEVTSAAVDIPQAPAVGDPNYYQKMSIRNDALSQLNNQRNHEALMKVYEGQAQKSMWGLGLQATGMFAQMYGAHAQGKAVEKERKRILDWKPTGEEVLPSNPDELMYPDGIIS